MPITVMVFGYIYISLSSDFRFAYYKREDNGLL